MEAFYLNFQNAGLRIWMQIWWLLNHLWGLEIYWSTLLRYAMPRVWLRWQKAVLSSNDAFNRYSIENRKQKSNSYTTGIKGTSQHTQAAFEWFPSMDAKSRLLNLRVQQPQLCKKNWLNFSQSNCQELFDDLIRQLWCWTAWYNPSTLHCVIKTGLFDKMKVLFNQQNTDACFLDNSLNSSLNIKNNRRLDTFCRFVK